MLNASAVVAKTFTIRPRIGWLRDTCIAITHWTNKYTYFVVLSFFENNFFRNCFKFHINAFFAIYKLLQVFNNTASELLRMYLSIVFCRLGLPAIRSSGRTGLHIQVAMLTVHRVKKVIDLTVSDNCLVQFVVKDCQFQLKM